MSNELVFDSSYGSWSPSESDGFESCVADAAGLRNVADGKLVSLMIEALAGDLWQGSGIHSPVQWLMWRAGLCRATARRVTTLAARAGDLPVTIGLLAEGRLSLDQAHAVARYTPAAFEESVCELAQCATVSQIISATRCYDFDVEKPASPDPVRRGVSFGHDDDGTWWARIRLAAEEGAIVEAALGQVRDHLHDEARETAKEVAEAEGRSTKGTDEELGVTTVGWSDAFVGMANAVLSNGPGGSTDQARRTVHIHLEVPVTDPGSPHTGTPGDPDDAFRWVAEMHGGARLPDWLARQLTCDCDINMIWHKNGKPFSASANFRSPSVALRRVIEHRDRYHCRVPGCTRTRWLEAHHIVHWQNGGKTVSSNLVMLCGKHHRLHHQGFLYITGDADVPDGPGAGERGGLVFANQYGVELEWVGTPSPPAPDGLPVVEPYVCPTGERLQKQWVSFHPSPTSGVDSDPADAIDPGHRPEREPAA